jgi:hypothetical protein
VRAWLAGILSVSLSAAGAEQLEALIRAAAPSAGSWVASARVRRRTPCNAVIA